MRKPQFIKLFVTIFIIGIGIPLTSCSDNPNPTSVISSKISPESTSTPATKIPNVDLVEISPSPLSLKPTFSEPTPTATSPYYDPAKQECPDFFDAIPSGTDIEGEILLQKDLRDFYIFNPATLEKEIFSIPSGVALSIRVSPDGKRIAQQFPDHSSDFSEEKSIFTISNSSGIQEKSFSLETIPLKGYLGDWVNNQQVYFVSYDNSNNIDYNLNTVWTIFNPETEEQLLFSGHDFPSFNDTNKDIRMYFDPTISRSVYLDLLSPILYDMQTKKILAHLHQRYASSLEADWNSDGSKVAIVGNYFFDENSDPDSEEPYTNPDEIFILDRDGKLLQTTHLRDIYGNDISPMVVRWSPNGRYIAAWLYVNINNEDQSNLELRLVLIDTVTQKVTDFCISMPDRFVHFYIPPPRWSPNSKQILVSPDIDENGSNRIYIIDIEKNVAYKVDENIAPIGWLANTP